MNKSRSCEVFIIDDDEMFSECVATAAKKVDNNVTTKCFKNAVEAMNSLEEKLPDLIFLDILLPGPDGFTFLNELASYIDTAKIPVILVTSLNLPETDLSIYGVQGILNKENMTPKEVENYVKRYPH